MDIFSFIAHFGTEEDCRNHFKAEQDKMGVTCKCTLYTGREIAFDEAYFTVEFQGGRKRKRH